MNNPCALFNIGQPPLELRRAACTISIFCNHHYPSYISLLSSSSRVSIHIQPEQSQDLNHSNSHHHHYPFTLLIASYHRTSCSFEALTYGRFAMWSSNSSRADYSFDKTNSPWLNYELETKLTKI